MDLITSKVMAAKMSRSLKKKVTIWLNEKEGEFYLAYNADDQFVMLLYDDDGTAEKIGRAQLNKYTPQAAYSNGSEVALDVEQEESNKKHSKAQKQNVKVMNTVAKKADKKAAKKATGKPVGKLVSLTVKAIKEAVRKGAKAYNEAGKPLPIGYLDKMKDATRELKATIVKAEAA